MAPDSRASTRRRQGAWYVSALAYRWSSTAVSDQADEDLFRYLGAELEGAVVVDCGCGPGLLTGKLLAQGARSVVAVDANPAMVRQVNMRFAKEITAGTVTVVQDFVDGKFFASLPQTPDIVIFKRSLYASRASAITTLTGAVKALPGGGFVVVIHPERSLGRYVLGEPRRWRRHSLFHLLNRLISQLAVGLGISSYSTHTADELVGLLDAAAGTRPVVRIPTTQQAYNLAAIAVPSDTGIAER